jgi:hypothetical protein
MRRPVDRLIHVTDNRDVGVLDVSDAGSRLDQHVAVAAERGCAGGNNGDFK